MKVTATKSLARVGEFLEFHVSGKFDEKAVLTFQGLEYPVTGTGEEVISVRCVTSGVSRAVLTSDLLTVKSEQVSVITVTNFDARVAPTGIATGIIYTCKLSAYDIIDTQELMLVITVHNPANYPQDANVQRVIPPPEFTAIDKIEITHTSIRGNSSRNFYFRLRANWAGVTENKYYEIREGCGFNCRFNGNPTATGIYITNLSVAPTQIKPFAAVSLSIAVTNLDKTYPVTDMKLDNLQAPQGFNSDTTGFPQFIPPGRYGIYAVYATNEGCRGTGIVTIPAKGISAMQNNIKIYTPNEVSVVVTCLNS